MQMPMPANSRPNATFYTPSSRILHESFTLNAAILAATFASELLPLL